ncbi:phytase [Stigmatella sp. ncwal1]|uniref:Phytase n=1 Tax=Stigmatella ashevillensis TaxID=2995309 RepID=A0ABT5D749_9BACT|nr:myxosortase-dependent phytase-like phosphatase [Stigmatella ashevillena]MDC0709386.1 phytase [Stigmatella ashevillena]
MRIPRLLKWLVVLGGLPAVAQPVEVSPVRETQAVNGVSGGSPEGALWRDGTFPDRSLFITADPTLGVVTYQLDGGEREVINSSGVAYAVDVIDGFPLAGGTTPLIVVANGTSRTLTAYVVDPTQRVLRPVDASSLNVPNFDPRTVNLYRSSASGKVYVFTANPGGTMQQLELTPYADGGIGGASVRSFEVGGSISGVVVDADQRALYVSVPDTGIWRFPAEPTDTSAGTIAVGVSGTNPPAGLALYAVNGQDGYLLSTAGGSDEIFIYARRSPYGQVGSFTISETSATDQVDRPLFLEVSALPLGSSFPQGFVAVHDAINAPSQNYKFVSWADISKAFSPPLQVRGAPENPDGGAPDGGDGGRPDGSSGVGPGGGGTPVDDGCGCSSASMPGMAFLALAGLAWGGRGRRRRQEG